MKKNVLVTNKERPFDVNALFFSTTDQKGIITSCNKVFTEVAEYEPSEVLGKPHNLIRHPHMPRCVFHLLWQYLLSNRSIGAYVKNRSKSGDYYWVFALAMPTPEGFISIRLKPTSPLLVQVGALYERLRSVEDSFGDEWRQGMQASCEMLMRELASLGFASYDEFMASALQSEVGSRYKLMEGATPSATANPLQRAFNDLENLRKLKTDLSQRNSFFESFAGVLMEGALNLGVQAARLADKGRALGVICNEISTIATRVRSESSKILKENSTLTLQLEQSCFNISFAALLIEMLAFFQEEQKRLSISQAEQRRCFGKTFEELEHILRTCLGSSLKRAIDSRAQLCTVFASFESFAEQLGKILLSIQFSYVTGKSLAAAIADTGRFSLQLLDIIEKSEQARKDVDFIKTQVNRLRGAVAEWELRA